MPSALHTRVRSAHPLTGFAQARRSCPCPFGRILCGPESIAFVRNWFAHSLTATSIQWINVLLSMPCDCESLALKNLSGRVVRQSWWRIGRSAPANGSTVAARQATRGQWPDWAFNRPPDQHPRHLTPWSTGLRPRDCEGRYRLNGRRTQLGVAGPIGSQVDIRQNRVRTVRSIDNFP